MTIKGIVWLDDVIEKLIQKHHVQQNEVTEILSSKPRFRFIEKGHRPGETIYAAMGQSHSGRYLIIFFAYKRDKSALILSARDMTKPERRRYEQA